jgi:hypothetical protein
VDSVAMRITTETVFLRLRTLHSPLSTIHYPLSTINYSLDLRLRKLHPFWGEEEKLKTRLNRYVKSLITISKNIILTKILLNKCNYSVSAMFVIYQWTIRQFVYQWTPKAGNVSPKCFHPPPFIAPKIHLISEKYNNPLTPSIAPVKIEKSKKMFSILIYRQNNVVKIFLIFVYVNFKSK